MVSLCNNNLFIYVFIYSLIRLFIYLFVCLSVCLFIKIFIYQNALNTYLAVIGASELFSWE